MSENTPALDIVGDDGVPQTPELPPAPVFILRTRSFWLGIFPAMMALLDFLTALTASNGHGPVAALLLWLLHIICGFVGIAPPPWTVDDVAGAMVGLLPLCTLLVAHQRRGENRPYTMDPTAK